MGERIQSEGREGVCRLTTRPSAFDYPARDTRDADLQFLRIYAVLVAPKQQVLRRQSLAVGIPTKSSLRLPQPMREPNCLVLRL